MRTNTEDGQWPVVLVVAGENEPSDLIFEIARQQKYVINFYYDVVETQKQAIARVKQLAEYGREVIGVIIDEPYNAQWEKHWPVVQVKEGEVAIWHKTIPNGNLWDKATEELLEIIHYENISGTP
jgi:hypothetical protein